MDWERMRGKLGEDVSWERMRGGLGEDELLEAVTFQGWNWGKSTSWMNILPTPS